MSLLGKKGNSISPSNRGWRLTFSLSEIEEGTSEGASEEESGVKAGVHAFLT